MPSYEAFQITVGVCTNFQREIKKKLETLLLMNKILVVDKKRKTPRVQI